MSRPASFHIGGSGIPASASMQGPVLGSVLFHLALVLSFSISLPYVTKPLPEISTPVSVEIVEIDELTQTDFAAPPRPQVKDQPPPEPKNGKPKPAPKMTAETPPDLTEPAPPEVETIENAPDVVPPKPLQRKILKKPEPPKPPEPEVTKTAQAKPKKDFQSLLKNLMPEEAPATEDQTQDPPPQNTEPAGQITRLNDRLTMSEQDALRRQLAQCWNVMAGAKYAEDLVVEVRVQMNRDRTVQNAQILNNGRYNADTHYRAAADAALRALRNPRCSPLALPEEKYEQWKTTVLVFDPRQML